MSHLAQQCSQLKEKLRLSTEPIGYKRLENSNELEDIKGVRRWKQDCVLGILEKIGFKYPITNIGAFVDPNPILAGFYPTKKK